jgi:hypothetical protein
LPFPPSVRANDADDSRGRSPHHDALAPAAEDDLSVLVRDEVVIPAVVRAIGELLDLILP